LAGFNSIAFDNNAVAFYCLWTTLYVGCPSKRCWCVCVS